MKKILFILTATMALSIVVFGFSSRVKTKGHAGNNIPKRAVRFNIFHALDAGRTLRGTMRVTNTVTGNVAHETPIQLIRKNGTYVCGPILLDHGKYRVEVTTYMPDGTQSTFTNLHEFVVKQKPLDVHHSN